MTSYMIIIGSKEARESGLVDKNGEPKEITKTVDTDKKEIVIKANE